MRPLSQFVKIGITSLLLSVSFTLYAVEATNGNSSSSSSKPNIKLLWVMT